MRSLRTVTHLESFDGRASFSNWLTRIAINAALMKLRKNRGSREIPMVEFAGTRDALLRFEPADWHPDPEENYAQQERKRVVAGAIRTLRPALRRVMEIGELQEFSMMETAAPGDLRGSGQGKAVSRQSRVAENAPLEGTEAGSSSPRRMRHLPVE
jgi:RNA polymerase sigma factor (sigma-70 family)